MTSGRRIGVLQNSIVVAGDLCGGFHLLSLEKWEDIATTICSGRDRRYLKKILHNLRAADTRRKEWNAFVCGSQCYWIGADPRDV
jgi:hypothetical protein